MIFNFFFSYNPLKLNWQIFHFTILHFNLCQFDFYLSLYNYTFWTKTQTVWFAPNNKPYQQCNPTARNLTDSMSLKCSCSTHWLKNKRKTIPLDPNCSKLSSLSTLSMIFTDWELLTKTIKWLSSIMHGLRKQKAFTSSGTESPYEAKLKLFSSESSIKMETWMSISASKEKLTYIHFTSKLQTPKRKLKTNTLNN